MSRRILNFFIILLLIIVAIPTSVSVVRAAPWLFRVAMTHRENLAAFCGGIALWGLIWAYLLRRWDNYRFLETLDHEMVHIIFAVLTGGKVKSASVSSLGAGSVNVERSNALVYIAPYLISLPLFLIPLLYSTYGTKTITMANFLNGLILSYHLIKTIGSSHPRQQDFDATTIPVAYFLILAGMIFTLGWSLALAGGGLPGGKRLLIEIGRNFREVPVWIVHKIPR